VTGASGGANNQEGSKKVVSSGGVPGNSGKPRSAGVTPTGENEILVSKKGDQFEKQGAVCDTWKTFVNSVEYLGLPE